MFTVQDYCKCCKEDAYGGSIELVDAGILALLNEIQSGTYNDVREFCKALEQFVDSILLVSTSVLPLINLLIKVLAFAKEKERETDLKAVRNQAVQLLLQHQDNQNHSTKNIGVYGSRIIKDLSKIGTFSTSGTVMSILQEAVKDKKRINAVCFEARPHNEGYRTLKEIAELDIPVVLGVDALLCCLIPKCDLFIIGVDAITAEGAVYAKTGSYLAALACKEFGIPFYVAADTSKFDTLSVYGFPLKSSDRPIEEVTNEKFPKNASIRNISFELIPSYLIHAIITEKGIVPPSSIGSIAKVDVTNEYVINKLADWVNSDR